MNPFKRLLDFVRNPSNTRTVGILAVLVITLAIPLTVNIAQKQQELRQQADYQGQSCGTMGGTCDGRTCNYRLTDEEGNPAIRVDPTGNAFCQGIPSANPPPTSPAPAQGPSTTNPCPGSWNPPTYGGSYWGAKCDKPGETKPVNYSACSTGTCTTAVCTLYDESTSTYCWADDVSQCNSSCETTPSTPCLSPKVTAPGGACIDPTTTPPAPSPPSSPASGVATSCPPSSVIGGYPSIIHGSMWGGDCSSTNKEGDRVWTPVPPGTSGQCYYVACQRLYSIANNPLCWFNGANDPADLKGPFACPASSPSPSTAPTNAIRCLSGVTSCTGPYIPKRIDSNYMTCIDQNNTITGVTIKPTACDNVAVAPTSAPAATNNSIPCQSGNVGCTSPYIPRNLGNNLWTCINDKNDRATPTSCNGVAPTSVPVSGIQLSCGVVNPICPVGTGLTAQVLPNGNWACINQQTQVYSTTYNPFCQSGAGSATLSLSLNLQGLGNIGDVKNPGTKVFNTPTKNRTITVQLLDTSTNSVMSTGTGGLSYNYSTGLFTGTVALPNIDSAKSYNLKVKANGYLWKSFGTIIVTGQTVTNGTLGLITGDINDSNSVEALDVNILMSCSIYSTDNGAACNSNPVYRSLSDLNDDQKVDQIDYNLILREFGQTGN